LAISLGRLDGWQRASGRSAAGQRSAKRYL